MSCHFCNKSMQPEWCYCPHCGAKESTQDNTAQPARSNVPSTSNAPTRSSVRAQVFEVIIKQAETGAPWRLLCAGPMKVSHITEEMVEKELQRRKAEGNSTILEPPLPHDSKILFETTVPQSQLIANMSSLLEELSKEDPATFSQKQLQVKAFSLALKAVFTSVRDLENELESYRHSQ